jgi:hypothetical protein
LQIQDLLEKACHGQTLQLTEVTNYYKKIPDDDFKCFLTLSQYRWLDRISWSVFDWQILKLVYYLREKPRTNLQDVHLKKLT